MCVCVYFNIYLFERESARTCEWRQGWGCGREGERESQANSGTKSQSPTQGLIS